MFLQQKSSLKSSKNLFKLSYKRWFFD